MTHLTRANVPSDDDSVSALTVSMKRQTSVSRGCEADAMVQINP